MQTTGTEFEALHSEVLCIDPLARGSLGRISRMKAAVDKLFEENRIPDQTATHTN